MDVSENDSAHIPMRVRTMNESREIRKGIKLKRVEKGAPSIQRPRQDEDLFDGKMRRCGGIEEIGGE